MIWLIWCYHANIFMLQFPNAQDNLWRFSSIQTILLVHDSSYIRQILMCRCHCTGSEMMIIVLLFAMEQLGNHASALNINIVWRSHAEGMCCYWCESWRLWCWWEGSGMGQGVRGNIDCVEPQTGAPRIKTQNQFFILVLWASGYKSAVTLKSKNKQWKLVSRALS